MALTALSVRHLSVEFQGPSGPIRALADVTFDVGEGEVVSIVGESGSGKSTLCLSLLGLASNACVTGEVIVFGRSLLNLRPAEMRKIRGGVVGSIAQNTLNSLNPNMKISDQVAEVTRRHLGHSRAEARRHVIRMLGEVGIQDARMRANSYPHQLSAGMRQRVLIAMAVACKPKLIIADEPTSGLDVSVRSHILRLFRKLVLDRGSALLLVSHDMRVVSAISDRTLVMYRGFVVESGPTGRVLDIPGHPYTRSLLACEPDLSRRGQRLPEVRDLGQSRVNFGDCPYASNCCLVDDRCIAQFPPTLHVGEDHRVMCWFPGSRHD